MILREPEVVRASLIHELSLPDGAAYDVYAGIMFSLARN